MLHADVAAADVPVVLGVCEQSQREAPVDRADPEDVLEQVLADAHLDVVESDDPSVRGIEMAQDFYAEFGLGTTDKAFNPVDAHGVEMAAIQALTRKSGAGAAKSRRWSGRTASTARLQVTYIGAGYGYAIETSAARGVPQPF